MPVVVVVVVVVVEAQPQEPSFGLVLLGVEGVGETGRGKRKKKRQGPAGVRRDKMCLSLRCEVREANECCTR